MSILQDLRTISPKDFAVMGMDDIAYVKPIRVKGGTAHAVHAADGARIGVFDDRELAFAVVLQHDLEPVSAH